MRDLQVGVEDLELRGRLDVGRLHDAGAARSDVHLDLGRVAVQPADEPLQVEDDVGDVLADALQRRELVRDPLDLHRGDRCALERREQHAAQRVSERVTKAAVERLDLEDAALLVDFLVDDLRDLEFHQGCACCQSVPFYFEYSSTMSDSWTGVSISDRSGHLRIFPVSPSWSACSHGATDAVRSVASRITCCAEEFGDIVITSSGLTWKLGMFTRRPLTLKWPWRTSWRAWARDAANPSR